MKKIKLDAYEQEIEDAFLSGQLKSELTPKRRKFLEDAARNTLKRDARVNLRLTSRDLRILKQRAAVEGLPYQTYIASQLHKLVTSGG